MLRNCAEALGRQMKNGAHGRPRYDANDRGVIRYKTHIKEENMGEQVRFRNFLRHSASVSHAVLRSDQLTLQEKGLYSILCSYGWSGAAFPGQKRLAAENDVSERTIRRIIKRLIELGLITVEDRRKQNKTNIYYIEFPDDQIMKKLFPNGYDHILSKNDEPQDTDVLRGGDHRTPVSSGHRTPVSSKDISEEKTSDKNAQPPSGRAKITYPSDFEKFWSVYPRKVEKKRTFEIWKRRIKTYSPEILIQSAKNYAEYCKNENVEIKYIKHPKTFLSDKLDFEDWLVTKQSAPIKPAKSEQNPQPSMRPNAGAYKKFVFDY